MKRKWVCPKCGRKFEKKNQIHSCIIYPLEKHFKNKEDVARPLYNKLLEKIRGIGPCTVESLPCCIHLVGAYSFAAVYALKDGIRLHFGLDRKLASPRIDKSAQVTKTKYMFSVNIKKEDEIDKELMSWLEQSYNLKKG